MKSKLIFVCAIFSPQRTVGANDEDHLTHLAKVLQLLAKNIESFSTGELRLPETEMALITKCPVYNCPGELELASSAAQDMLRSRPKNIDIEPHGLKCPICQVTYTVTSRIDAALQSGYRRCFGKEQLTKKEVIDLIWLGMPLQPNAEDVNAFDRWLLHFASIQVLVNMHDWKHRSSCFKNGRLFCRYPPSMSLLVKYLFRQYSSIDNPHIGINYVITWLRQGGC
jgi:hypothetical protein